jgi:hypothetical protein
MNKKKSQEDGFSLLECVLAIGVLSVVLASIVGLHSTIIANTQISKNSLQAAWAARAMMAHMQYLLDTPESENNLPKNTSFLWKSNQKFFVLISKTEFKEIKLSHFLMTYLGIYKFISPRLDENLETENMLSPIIESLDSALPAGAENPFKKITLEIHWNTGSIQKKLQEKFFFVQKNIFNGVTLPNIGNENKKP